MAFRSSQLLALVALTALSTVACGGNSDEGTGDEPGASAGGGGGGGGGGSGPGPTGECTEEEADVPGNHCFPGMADPCANPITTDYPGDEYCLEPPVNGFQMHVGPSNYDDPAELEAWSLPPGGYPVGDPRRTVIGEGADINWCYYQKSPNDRDLWMSRSFSRMRPGSHHYIAFQLPVGSDVADSTAPGSCDARNGEAFGGSNFLSGATRAVQNIAMFGDAPEDEGLGSIIPAHAQLNQNLHFVNIGDEPVLQELWVNSIEIPAEEVTNRVRAVTWYGGLGMNVPYGAHQLVESSICDNPSAYLGSPVRLLGATAHAHANTLRVSVHKLVNGVKEPIFHDFNWDEPTVWRWNSATQNPSADLAASKSGALVNGTFMVGPDDKFSWECEVINKSPDKNNLVFSDKAYSGEMCNIFGMYAHPKAESPWACFSLTGGRNL